MIGRRGVGLGYKSRLRCVRIGWEKMGVIDGFRIGEMLICFDIYVFFLVYFVFIYGVVLVGRFEVEIRIYILLERFFNSFREVLFLL